MAKREFCVGDPMQPIFHLFVLGVCVGGNANFNVRVGGNANFSVFVLGVLSNANPQGEKFCVAVEYKL